MGTSQEILQNLERVDHQSMYIAEHLLMAASGIVVISTISNVWRFH